METTNKAALTLYVRHGCHLCEDMLAVLDSFADELAFTVTTIDIDRNPALRARYDTLVPVLALEDRQICHYFLDLDALKRTLADFQHREHANR